MFYTIYSLLFIFVTVSAVPLSMVMNSPGISNNAIEEMSDDDDSTTHTLERLSSAAPCLVAGVEYTHGQQIYRADQCEFCLCLDGEMFCWWQECPPTMEGPCRERGPFSSCQNGQSAENMQPPKLKPSVIIPTILTSSNNKQYVADEIVPESTDFSADESSTDFTDSTLQEISISSTSAPKICIVMGRSYNIGERLPHDTGNCVECICGVGAQITCSPHQCGPPSDDINDYRPPGLRSAQPDVF